MKRIYKTYCEYCGCTVSDVVHFDVTVSQKPAKTTSSGTRFFTNGKKITYHQIRLCNSCAELASDTLFKKVLQIPDGTITYTKKKGKAYA